MEPVETAPAPEAFTIELLSAPLDEAPAVTFPVEARAHPRFERPLQASVREARLLDGSPWVRGLGKIALDVTTEGWRFPMPPETLPPRPEVEKPRVVRPEPEPEPEPEEARKPEKTVRLRPPRDAVQ